MWLEMAAEDDDPVIWPVFAQIPQGHPDPLDPVLRDPIRRGDMSKALINRFRRELCTHSAKGFHPW